MRLISRNRAHRVVTLFAFPWYTTTSLKVELVMMLAQSFTFVAPVSLTVKLAQALTFVTSVSFFTSAESVYSQTFSIMFFTTSVAQEYF